MVVALSFNDDNDKHKEGGNKKRNIKNRLDITHKCKHKISYPGNPKFDYSIKDKNCPMCEEWDNPEQQMELEGVML